MFAVRIALLTISILLLSGAVEPERGWFIALTVLASVSVLGSRTVSPLIQIGPGRAGRHDFRWRDRDRYEV